MTSVARLCACGCNASLAGRRPDARFATPSCRSRASRGTGLPEDERRARRAAQLSPEDREACRRLAAEGIDELVRAGLLRPHPPTRAERDAHALLTAERT